MRLAPSPPDLSARIDYAPSGPRQVWDTVARMREMIRRSRVDPRVIQSAVGITYTTPERDGLSQVRALFEYVRDQIRYVLDVHQVETLCDPAMTLQRMVGDCDDQTALLCSLAEAIGYPTRLVMAGYSSEHFEHVYCQIFASGIWIDCDPTERQPFGWVPPGAVSIWIEGGS